MNYDFMTHFHITNYDMTFIFMNAHNNIFQLKFNKPFENSVQIIKSWHCGKRNPVKVQARW